jgi:tetraacyldisaccharide 4'-kinase
VRFIERVWSGEAPRDAIARAVLSPFELAFRGIVAVRAALYDSGILKSRTSPIPVISIGNLTVGGTGKTPVAAWITSRLVAAGKSPAIILRGYGGDENLVHKFLNPAVPILEATDRASGVLLAADSGANIAILDDAFQHRRAARDVDIVLVSADDWTAKQRLLPAGPYREPAAALSRASIVIITRKIATDEMVAQVENFVRRTAPAILVGVVRLEIGELVQVGGSKHVLETHMLRDKSVLAVSGIGNPRAFQGQLEATGARVVSMQFPDHHSFTTSDISEIALRARTVDYAVCTLKDAVKLGPQWPADAGPLWYVSLSVKVERGEAAIGEILTRLDGKRDISKNHGY